MPDMSIGDTLAADALQAAKFAAAMQFPKRLLDVAEPILLAAAKKHGRATVVKARAALAFLRTEHGQTMLMGLAGVGLMYLPASTPARRVLRQEIAPVMRQLAMGKGLDRLFDEIVNPLLAAVEKIGESMAGAVEASEQIEADNAPSGVRVDAALAPPTQAVEAAPGVSRNAAKSAT